MHHKKKRLSTHQPWEVMKGTDVHIVRFNTETLQPFCFYVAGYITSPKARLEMQVYQNCMFPVFNPGIFCPLKKTITQFSNLPFKLKDTTFTWPKWVKNLQEQNSNLSSFNLFDLLKIQDLPPPLRHSCSHSFKEAFTLSRQDSPLLKPIIYVSPLLIILMHSWPNEEHTGTYCLKSIKWGHLWEDELISCHSWRQSAKEDGREDLIRDRLITMWSLLICIPIGH